ncbi:MAG: hypothetical protein WKG32_13195 [Gemmatimonadaceae bacterium]
MGKNERTSTDIASIASRGLRGLPLTKAEIKRISGTALTQAADKPKPKGKGKS